MIHGDADFPLHGLWDRPSERAGALVFAVDAAGRVLLQLRDDAPGVPHGGLFAPFGGGVEPGEALAEAALREIREETGLVLAEADLTPLARVLSRPRRTRLYAFAAACPAQPAAIRLGEGAGFAFLTPAQVLRLPVVPELRGAALEAPGVVARRAAAAG